MSAPGGRLRLRALGAVAGLTSLAAWIGAVQLAVGLYAPPVADLQPLRLHSWLLPAIWLAASVAVPCLIVTVLAVRRSLRTGWAALVAALLLAVELVVQVPFVGLDPLQAVMGTTALVIAGLGLAEVVAQLGDARPEATPRH